MNAKAVALSFILVLIMIASPVSSFNIYHSGSQNSVHELMGKESANHTLSGVSTALRVSARNSSKFPESYGQQLFGSSSVPSQYTYSGNLIQANETLNIIGNTILYGSPNGTSFYDPASSVFDPFNNLTYLSDPSSQYVLAVNPKGTITNIHAFGGITGIVYDSANHLVYVASRTNGMVAAIGSTSVAFTINVSVAGYGGPNELCYDPLSNIVYAAALNETFLIQDNYVVGNISWDMTPGSSALFDPENGYVYMDSNSSIAVFSGTRNLGSISMGSAGILTPGQMTYNDAAGEVYASFYGSSSIYVLRNMTLIKTLSFSNAPMGYYGQSDRLSSIAYNPWNGRTYLVFSQKVLQESSLYWFNSVNTLNPVNVSMRSAGKMSYNSVAHAVVVPVIISSVPALLVINGSTVSEKFWLGTDMTSSAYDTSDGTLYVTNALNNTLILIRKNTVISYISSGGVYPEKVLYDPINGYLYVLNNGSNSLVVLNSHGIISTLQVGSNPAGMAAGGSSGIVYVSNSGSDNITVISGKRVIGSIELGALPGPMCYDASNRLLYVAINSMEVISLISGNRIVQNLSMQHFFDINSMVYDSENGLVYIAQNGGSYGSMLQIYSGESLAKTMSKGQGSLFYDEGNGIVYTQSNNGRMTAMSGLNETPTLNAIAGSGPLPGSFDAANGTLYVVGGTAGTVSIFEGIVNPVHSVYLNETGLPAGIEWNLSIFGISVHTPGTWMEFNLTDGNYEYNTPLVTVGGTGYEASPVPLNFIVNGTGLSIAVTFRRVALYPITITESGLPSGSFWNIATSLGQSVSTNTSELILEEPNGTIDFKAHGPSNIWKTVPGAFTVNGSKMNTSISFSEYENDIEFVWYYTTSSLPNVKYYFNVSGQKAIVYNQVNSLGGVLIIPNGTYSYTYTAPGKIARGFITSLQWITEEYSPQSARSIKPVSRQTFTVAGLGTEYGTGNAIATGVVWILETKLIFTETGLPAGAIWYLNFAPNYNMSWTPAKTITQLNRTTSYTIFSPVYELNGSYSYFAGVASQTSINGQIVAQPGGFTRNKGTFSLRSSFVFEGYTYSIPVVYVKVAFERVVFNVSLSETGLNEGASWAFDINGKSYSTGTGVTVLRMEFGYYSLCFSAPADYYVSRAPSSIFVNRTEVVTVHFLEYSYITGSTFPGANVSINGNSVNFTGSYFSMREKTGNYSVVIEQRNGTYVDNFTLAPGQTVFLNYGQKAQVTTNPFSSFNLLNLLLSIISGVEAAAIVLLYVMQRGRKRP